MLSRCHWFQAISVNRNKDHHVQIYMHTLYKLCICKWVYECMNVCVYGIWSAHLMHQELGKVVGEGRAKGNQDRSQCENKINLKPCPNLRYSSRYCPISLSSFIEIIAKGNPSPPPPQKPPQRVRKYLFYPPWIFEFILTRFLFSPPITKPSNQFPT